MTTMKFMVKHVLLSHEGSENDKKEEKSSKSEKKASKNLEE